MPKIFVSFTLSITSFIFITWFFASMQFINKINVVVFYILRKFIYTEPFIDYAYFSTNTFTHIINIVSKIKNICVICK